MSSVNKYELVANIRKDQGKGASRRLRHENKVPGIVYGAGDAPVSLVMEHNKLTKLLENESVYSRVLTLNIEGKTEKIVLKAIQRHPTKPRIVHMDLLRVRADQKLIMNIPLHFQGEENAPGIKEGGVITHLMTDVEISCLPADLPEFINVDVSQLALNHSIHLSDLTLPKGAELVAFMHGDEKEHDLPIVTIQIPRAIEESTAAPVAEGEVPTVGSEEASDESDKS